MKTLTRFAVVLSSALLSFTACAEDKPAAPPPSAAEPGHGPGMGMMGEMDEKQMEAMMRQMQEHQLKVHDMMHRIRDAKDEKERTALKEEHLKLMKEHMDSMRSHKQMRMMQMQHNPQMKDMSHQGEKKTP